MRSIAYTDELIAGVLANAQTIAMVGASDATNRPSYFAMKYLLGKHYRIIPVNPRLAGRQILGQRVYAALADVPSPVDIVDIFRAFPAAFEVVREAIRLRERLRIKVIWMQLGIASDAAAAEAEAAGLQVIMNRCPKIEYGRLSSEIAWMGVNTRTLSSKKATIGGIQRMSLNRTTGPGGATEAAARVQRDEAGR
jgi:uncharacterized protein